MATRHKEDLDKPIKIGTTISLYSQAVGPHCR
jgi:hypothetical protein